MDGLVFSYPQMTVTIFIDSNDFHNVYLKSGIFVYNHNVLVFMMIIINYGIYTYMYMYSHVYEYFSFKRN